MNRNLFEALPSTLPRTCRRINGWLVCWLFIVVLPLHASTSEYSIGVDTKALAGSHAQLVFDFIAGGPPSNSIEISNFSTDGALGSSAATGGVTGSLPGTVTLSDSSFFNEYSVSLTFGHAFTFLLDASANPPPSGSIPDGFSLALLNPQTSLPLFFTTDPTGADSLFLLNIDGSPEGLLDVYTALGGQVTVRAAAQSSVPELSSALSVALTVLWFACGKRCLAFGKSKHRS
jgi:hypothetical protein